MYLIDTNVISEVRKGKNANIGVQDFFNKIVAKNITIYLSVISIGELRRGIENIRYRNDINQAEMLETWLDEILENFSDHILSFDLECAQLWGHLRVPNYEHIIDKQIAAIAMINGLTVVTRNSKDFVTCGVETFNPFTHQI